MHRVSVWTFSLGLLFCCALFAQRVKSTLSGVVTDRSSTAIPGAAVKLINEGTGLTAVFKTSVMPFAVSRVSGTGPAELDWKN